MANVRCALVRRMCFDLVGQGETPSLQCKCINAGDFFLCNIMVHLFF